MLERELIFCSLVSANGSEEGERAMMPTLFDFMLGAGNQFCLRVANQQKISPLTSP